MPIRFFAAFVLLLIGFQTGAAQAATALPVHSLVVRKDGRVIHLWLTIFDTAAFTLRVVDNAAPKDAPRFFDLAAAMRAEGCVAGCNGSFFERRPFVPVGLMVSDGRRAGVFEPKGWMKGLLVVRGDRPSLEAVDGFQPEAAEITALVQSGPWLVRAGQSEPDDNNTLQANRTFIGHDDKGRWILGASDACTLHELATLLRGEAVRAIIELQVALNLDGGPSTCLWVKGAPAPFYRREVWSVRNYIGVAPKERE